MIHFLHMTTSALLFNLFNLSPHTPLRQQPSIFSLYLSISYVLPKPLMLLLPLLCSVLRSRGDWYISEISLNIMNY